MKQGIKQNLEMGKSYKLIKVLGQKLLDAMMGTLINNQE